LAGDGPFAAEARRLGKSARTRGRLMDAAAEVFARDGFQAASVNEIARQADLSNGAFYVYFKDKDEIAGAVALAIAQAVAGRLDELMTDVDDAVERASLATRRFIDLASSRPDWGWALFHAMWRFDDLNGGVVAYLKADLERGAAQGHFTIPIDDFLINTFGIMTVGALVERLNGRAGADAGSRIAELQLRMLGVAPERAKAVAWSPMEPVALTLPSVETRRG
jgi:AcrR family transcriptional regulator